MTEPKKDGTAPVVVTLPGQVVPNPGDKPIDRPKVIVRLDDNKADLERAVEASMKLGGVTYLGLHKGDAIFESELDPDRFMIELLDVGVKVNKVMVKTAYDSGAVSIQGLLPLVITCSKCGKKMFARAEFSRTGKQLCSECLAGMIEAPVEKEDAVGGFEKLEGEEKDGDEKVLTSLEKARELIDKKLDQEQDEEQEQEPETEPVPSILPDVWKAADIAEHIELFEDNLLVEHVAPPDRTKGGIHLPKGSEISKNLENQLYIVLATGPGRSAGEKHMPMRVKVGDLAVIRRTVAVSFCQEQKDYHIVSNQDVVAVLHGVEAHSDNEPEVAAVG